MAGGNHALNQAVNITFTTKGSESVLAEAKRMATLTKKELKEVPATMCNYLVARKHCSISPMPIGTILIGLMSWA